MILAGDIGGTKSLLALFRNAPRVVIGAGTGLGLSYLVPMPGGHRPLASEAGHAGFAPADERQTKLWGFLHARFGRVELEHVLSGAGLARIHEFLGGGTCEPAAVTHAALEAHDARALESLDLFIACYGAAAGDHALNVMARGGVYVAGGIAPKILSRIAAGGFLAAFNAKGAFEAQARRMPLHVVVEERIALYGAAVSALRAAQGEPA